MPSVSESMPLLAMTTNGSGLMSPTFTQKDEDISAGVSSSGAGASDGAATSDGDGAVSSSVAGSNGAPLPPADAAHALATLASAALNHRHEVHDVMSSTRRRRCSQQLCSRLQRRAAAAC
ncbi:Host cell factor 1 [Operophtera brumata]|uniref:Host cell factor 1 n=1 Tax=Operophtera brumata TaxID=104452 RepID=A0A0L7L3A9_OPEBR|nr:Host cell factor 1 [Operophtera brumata]